MAARFATRHDAASKEPPSNTMPYPPLPASPTLTNPDMILPDYDRADSPDDDRSQSPILMWKNPSAADMRFHMPLQNNFPTGPVTPTTPIIYGNGTMLSDIGEVTEVESNVGSKPRRTSSRYSNFHDDDDATIGDRRSQVMSRERRASIESTSTITTQDPRAPFADFDDAVSVDDSNFQGDDEESMASSYVEGTPAPALHVSAHPVVQALNNENHSTSAISKRAEQILANAKKRLSTMEGNLTRARSSLNYSSMSDGSTPSPPMVRPATAVHQPTVPISPSHTRIKSDNSLDGVIRPSAFPQRSASALGAAGGYRKSSSSSSSKSSDAFHSGPNRTIHKISHYPLDMMLEPLSEDEVVSNADSRPESVQYTTFQSPALDSYADKELTRSASVSQMREIQDQMQGLKGKISTLKEQARADSLKRRSLQSLRTPSPFTHARWEHGFRETRSAHGAYPGSVGMLDQGDVEYPAGDLAGVNDVGANEIEGEQSPEEDNATETAGDVTPIATDDEVGRHGLNEQPPATSLDVKIVDDGRQEVQTDDVEVEQPALVESVKDVVGEHEVDEGEIEDDMHTENGDDVYDEEDEEEVEHGVEVDDADYESESGDSQYHESFQNPVSHEDREDAFDYEHFFLHSAMGSLSQKRHGRRDSSGSLSSEDSVETTRGPIVERTRRSSLETTSSADSFATATEGRMSRSSAAQSEKAKEAFTDGDDESDGPPSTQFLAYDGSGNNEIDATDGHQRYHNAFVHRAIGGTTSADLHRPSISSFESTGTNRSFPLVNKAKLNGGVLTPGGSPDHQLKQISHSLVNDTGGTADDETAAALGQSGAIQMLSKEDQLAVQRLVASLGKCVLGLSEGSRASTEGRLYRRRIEAAARALEGLDEQ